MCDAGSVSASKKRSFHLQELQELESRFSSEVDALLARTDAETVGSMHSLGHVSEAVTALLEIHWRRLAWLEVGLVCPPSRVPIALPPSCLLDHELWN